MALEKVYYLPVITVTLLIGTITITFWLSWTSKHVTNVPPYISDTGSHPPESCIFGQMLNIIALLTCMVIYIKYRQLRNILERYNFSDNLQKLNKLTLWLGYGASFGMSMVGNFQETNLLILHFIGAFFAFGFGALYQCFQSIISLKMYTVFRKMGIIAIKITLSVLSVITFLIFFVCSIISLSNYRGQDVTKWKPTDASFEVRICSAIAEWICATSTAFYILTLACDLFNTVVSEPIVILQDQFQIASNVVKRGN